MEWLRRTEIGLILLALGTVSFGTLVVYSASFSMVPGRPQAFLYKQLAWVIAGLLGAGIVALIDYRVLKRYAMPLYVANVFLLGVILIAGKTALGAQRWIEIAGFRFQPSEFAKLALIMTLAVYLDSRQDELGLKEVAGGLIHAALPMGLILLQPDLGTALVFAAVVAVMLYVAGVRLLHLAVVGAGSLAVGAAAFFLGLVHRYQLDRLVVFMNPELDPLGSGYNLRQSIIAIGSGGFFGKGLFSGTQSRLDFIPVRHTDFIFSVIGEELGFVGAAGLLIGLLLLASRALRVGVVSRSLLGLLIVSGIVAMWVFQIIVNVGMTVGIMPITGIPLPLISYGGSSTLVNLVSVGVILSVYRHRFAR